MPTTRPRSAGPSARLSAAWSGATAFLRRPGVQLGGAAAALVLGCAALGGLAAWGVPRLVESAERRTLERLDGPLTVSFSHVPAWLDGAIAREIAADAEFALVEADGSPFNREPLATVHRHLERSGWFVRVDQVRRASADRIEADVEFRRPFALVRWEGADHLVGAGGERIPLAFTEGPRPDGMPIVVGVTQPPPTVAGSPWIGADLHAALHLARWIHRKPWFAAGQVAAIDASRFSREGILELVTDRGDRLIWGGDPEARNVGEMPASEKIRCLDALWHHYRRIDGGTRGIDLRFDVVTRTGRREEVALGS